MDTLATTPARADFTIPYAVLALPGVSVPARLVLAELCALSVHHGGNDLAVANAHLAGRLWLSTRTVGVALHQLVAAGYVLRSTDPADRRHRLLRLMPLGEVAPVVPAAGSDASTVLTTQRGGAQ